MTDKTWLQAAKERCEAATEGPWEMRAEIKNAVERHYLAALDDEDPARPWWIAELMGCTPGGEADGDFIFRARTDLPLALRLLEQARVLLEAVEWVQDDEAEEPYCYYCPWCKNYKIRDGGHADDCGREAWLGRLSAGGDE